MALQFAERIPRKSAALHMRAIGSAVRIEYNIVSSEFYRNVLFRTDPTTPPADGSGIITLFQPTVMSALTDHLTQQLNDIRQQGLFKAERVIDSPQSADVSLQDGRQVLNLCANNYLGLADHPEILKAAHEALDRWGYGMASVRFICGTQTVHRQLESTLSQFLGMDDTILYSSCFDANGGLFETLLGPEDAVISDQLNHASIIDGIRLCKAQRFRYRNNDMADLENQLKAAADARHRLIATDGVFSMDGYLANLPDICDLADRYDAAVMVDDSHAVGFTGENGRGTHEHFGVMDRIDIITGTLGKALGGASGGYTAARQPIVDLLRQRSRPYLFSNTLAPPIAAASLKTLELLSTSGDLRDRLRANTQWFRDQMQQLGFRILPGEHPIVPVMIGDAALASTMADRLLERGIYVVGFSFPVVPKGEARIRTQMSAGHSQDDLERAVSAFSEVGKELDLC
ncbi:MAG: glycine C-acetyltransferase [Fuerstiella sp.]